MFSTTYGTDLWADDDHGYAMGTQIGLLTACHPGDSARQKAGEQVVMVRGLGQLAVMGGVKLIT
jgi:hypothetical protein